jgi:hypothetical protein
MKHVLSPSPDPTRSYAVAPGSDTDDRLSAIGAYVLPSYRVGFAAREPRYGVGNLLRLDLALERTCGEASARVIDVSVKPGDTVLTVIVKGANSRAQARVSAVSAPLAAV